MKYFILKPKENELIPYKSKKWLFRAMKDKKFLEVVVDDYHIIVPTEKEHYRIEVYDHTH